jgi:hypothetical protein
VTSKRLGHFQADVAASDDDRPPRTRLLEKTLEAQGVFEGVDDEDPPILFSGDIGEDRFCSRGEEKGVEGELARLAGGDGTKPHRAAVEVKGFHLRQDSCSCVVSLEFPGGSA